MNDRIIKLNKYIKEIKEGSIYVYDFTGEAVGFWTMLKRPSLNETLKNQVIFRYFNHFLKTDLEKLKERMLNDNCHIIRHRSQDWEKVSEKAKEMG